jgi:hypothetical protein
MTRRASIATLYSAAATPVGPWQEPAALVVLAVRGDFWDRRHHHFAGAVTKL